MDEVLNQALIVLGVLLFIWLALRLVREFRSTDGEKKLEGAAGERKSKEKT